MASTKYKPFTEEQAEAQAFDRKYKEAVMEQMRAKRDVSKSNPNTLLVLEKIQATKVKRQTDEMLLAKARDDLIGKNIVTKQAAFLLVAMRQRMLAAPQAYAKRIIGIQDVKVAKRVLAVMMGELLRDIRHLPEQVVDPHWLESLEEKDG
jgi:hypothetical protein